MEKLDASRSGTGTVLWRGLFVALAAGLSGIWIYLARVDQESRSDNQSDIPGIEVYRSIDELVARGDASVPQLVGRLTSENVATRRDAAMVLGRIGMPAAAAIPTLQSLVEDENASVRAMVLLTLGRIGVNLEELAPLAALRLVDQDATVRQAAAHILIAAGSVSEPFALTTLRAVNPDARRKALLVLRHVAVDEGAVREGLTQLFNDSRIPDDLRDDCIEMLLALDSPSLDVIEEGLVSTRVRTFSLAWPAAIETRQEPDFAWYSKIVSSALTRICTDDRRYSAAGPPPEFMYTGGLQLLPADVIMNSLMESRAEPEFIAPAIRNLLAKHVLPPARFVAALLILSRMGEKTDEFVPPLMSILERILTQETYPVPYVPHLGEAFVEVAPSKIPELLERVVWLLDNGSEPQRYAALSLVGQLGPAAAPLVPVAIDRLRSDDEKEVRTAHALLSVLKGMAAEAAPELTRMLANADEQWRRPWNLQSVTSTLIAVDRPAARAAIPRFVEIFNENKPGGSPQSSAVNRRLSSLHYLFEIDKDRPEFRQCLRVALRSSDQELRLRAAEMMIDLDFEIDTVVRLLAGDIGEIALELQTNLISDHFRQLDLLKRLGSRAAPAISPLTACLVAVGDRDPLPYIKCLEAIASPELLSDRSTDAAAAALASLLESPEEGIRRASVTSLAALGPVARTAVPALQAASRDPKNEIAGGRQPFRPGFAPYGYMSPIFKRFRDRKPPVRELIEEALSRIQSADLAQARLGADRELRTHRGNLLENPAPSLHAVAEIDGQRGGARGLGFSGAWARNVTYESDRPRSRFQIVRQPGLHRGGGGAASSPSPFDSSDRPRGVDRVADGISGASAHRMGRDSG